MGNVTPIQPGTPAQREAQPHARPKILWREALGALLREERTEQGRILADVARTAGVSTPYLSEIERGLKEPSSEILGAVADALGLSLVDIAAGVGAQLMRADADYQRRVLVLRRSGLEQPASESTRRGVVLAA